MISIYLTNGQSIRTSDNTAADLAGLLNANAGAVHDTDPGTTPQAIYQCTDTDENAQVHIVLDHIVFVRQD